MIGFAIALSGAVTNSEFLLDYAIWGVVAIVAQLLAFALCVLPFMPKIAERIQNNEVSAGVMLGAMSVAVGCLTPLCMSLLRSNPNMQTNSKQKRSSNIQSLENAQSIFIQTVSGWWLPRFCSVLVLVQKKEAVVFKNVDECTDALPGMAQQCETAYKGALAEAAKQLPSTIAKTDCGI